MLCKEIPCALHTTRNQPRVSAGTETVTRTIELLAAVIYLPWHNAVSFRDDVNSYLSTSLVTLLYIYLVCCCLCGSSLYLLYLPKYNPQIITVPGVKKTCAPYI